MRNFDPGSPVAIETVGNWYWIVDEIEAAGMEPRLVHALKAKLMLGAVNKTDKLDVRGLNLLQRAGTLPTVWIPPHGVRDARELPRTRMFLARERTRLKNRIHATLSKYAIDISEVRDIFGVRGRELIAESIDKLPYNTRFVTRCLLEHLEEVEGRLKEIEDRMREVFMWREGDRVFGEFAWCGVYFGGGDRCGGGGCGEVSEGGAFSILCGGDATGSQ